MTKKKKFLLSIVLVTILCLGIAYAYLTNTLVSNVQVTVANYKPLCKRASSPHTNMCTRTAGGCNADGITQNAPINYGSTFSGLSGTPIYSLKSGDAFDCDVNGDGTYDAKTERFYYITDLENDSNTAVLLYYSTVYGGVSNKTTSYVYGSYTNGPTTARAELPKTSQWKNVTLVKSTKRIRAQNDYTSVIISGTTYNFPQAFSYSGYAARLITYQEINKACSGTITSAGGLKNCNYLLEGTMYESTSNKITHILTQTPASSSANTVYAINVANRSLNPLGASTSGPMSSAKPVIEVPKSRIAL